MTQTNLTPREMNPERFPRQGGWGGVGNGPGRGKNTPTIRHMLQSGTGIIRLVFCDRTIRNPSPQGKCVWTHKWLKNAKKNAKSK